MDLHVLSKHHQYCVFHHEMIRDHIVMKLHDDKLSNNLYLDLELAIAQAHQMKAIETVLRGVQSQNPNTLVCIRISQKSLSESFTFG